MENQIYRGERLVVGGQLKNGSTVTTAYSLSCQIFSCWKKVMDVPMSIDTQANAYYCEIDTSNLSGVVDIRFVAHTAAGEKIVSNGFIQKTINE